MGEGDFTQYPALLWPAIPYPIRRRVHPSPLLYFAVLGLCEGLAPLPNSPTQSAGRTHMSTFHHTTLLTLYYPISPNNALPHPAPAAAHSPFLPSCQAKTS